MLLTEWAKKRAATPEGKGVYTHLFRVSGVSYKTVLKLARDGLGTRDYEVANKLSLATGGEVSIQEILYPEKFAKRSHRRSTIPPSAA
jgi:phosphoribosylaminoimidazole (AIR) synthetase